MQSERYAPTVQGSSGKVVLLFLQNGCTGFGLGTTHLHAWRLFLDTVPNFEVHECTSSMVALHDDVRAVAGGLLIYLQPDPQSIQMHLT